MMRGVAVVLSLALCAACSTGPVLIPKSDAVPFGVDLSGKWQIRDASADSMREKASLMHVFLETGSRLKITQTEHGLFVSFDRAVVEEYVFGEHGPVNVGPVVAERASGWEGDVYVIETADRKGHKLVEHYWLEDDGQTLVRKIALWKRNERELFIEQAFDRD